MAFFFIIYNIFECQNDIAVNHLKILVKTKNLNLHLKKKEKKKEVDLRNRFQ